MAEFNFNCRNCGNELRAAEEYRGMETLCPLCGKNTVIMENEAAASKIPVKKIPQKISAVSDFYQKNRKSCLIGTAWAASLAVSVLATAMLCRDNAAKVNSQPVAVPAVTAAATDPSESIKNNIHTLINNYLDALRRGSYNITGYFVDPREITTFKGDIDDWKIIGTSDKQWNSKRNYVKVIINFSDGSVARKHYTFRVEQHNNQWKIGRVGDF